MIKKHWPMLVTAVMFILSIVMGIVSNNAADTGVGILTFALVFMYGFPLCGALAGAWYGYRVVGYKKWLLPVIMFAVVCLVCVAYMIISGTLFELQDFWILGVFTLIATIVVELIAHVISVIVKTRRKHYSSTST